MKTWRQHRRSPRAAFSLIEMIGVLAIMAVLASVVVPNVLRSVDRAAIRGEEQTLEALGEQVKLFLRETGAPPTSSNWAAELAAYSDLAAGDLSRNRRGLARVLILDRATNPSERV
ncbi:MAG: type II secretion system protein, partial [Opitutaceae bacterium]